MSTEPMLPLPYRVFAREIETHDSATLHLQPVEDELATAQPGQFMMLYAPGVGEVAISVSGVDGALRHTIRDVGAVSRALHGATPGTVIGARGPFGVGWDLESGAGMDLVIIAGGVGLAPLRPLVVAARAASADFGRIIVVAGARSNDEFLFQGDLAAWAKDPAMQVECTIDVAQPGWSGPVGFVTDSLARIELDPDRSVAYVCGPEPMMRFSAQVLMRKRVPVHHIQVSLERNMKCGVALCGHCQLGPLLLCRDGPVVTYDVAAPLLSVRGL